MKRLPQLALVGRPNVGKSTLFNRISGQRKAITDARPGSTRDRNYTRASWKGMTIEIVDTGGLLLASPDPLLGPASSHARRAIAQADVVVFVVDGRAGLLPDDESIAKDLHRAGKPVLIAVNKLEGSEEAVVDFVGLGFDVVLPISAEHGRGVGDLLDAALALLPPGEKEGEGEEAPPLKVAILGRPNVGKSSLLNRLFGGDRALVSEIPGTTRDSIDSLIEREGKRYLFVDTAGIRKARLLKEQVDRVSVVRARRSIFAADVATLVIDAIEGFREMDATIAGYLQEGGKGVVIAVNKWDLAREKGLKEKALRESLADGLKFLSYAPVVLISARTGEGLGRLFGAIDRVQAARQTRVGTGPLNRVIARAVAHQAPKAAKGTGDLRILYATQIGVAPPTFLIATTRRVDLHFSYKRFLENQFRKAFGFEGTPLVLKVRARRH